jgi:hypothetical protein
LITDSDESLEKDAYSLDVELVEPNDPCRPEKCLWRSVLDRAVRDFMGMGVADMSKNEKRMAHLSALVWFEDYGEHPQGFEWVCEFLQIDSSRLREKLYEAYDRKKS